MITTSELALKTKDTFEGMTVKELKESCKVLGLTKYSKQTKPVLLERVWKATEPLRLKVYTENAIAQQKAEQDELAQARKQARGAVEYEVFGKEHIKQAFSDYEGDLERTAVSLYTKAMLTHKPVTILKTLTSKLKRQLELIEFHSDPIYDRHMKDTFYNQHWMKLMKPIRALEQSKDAVRINSYASKSTDKLALDSDEIIEWGLTHLDAENQLIRGIALAVLSGRRMVEVFGLTTFEQAGDFIHADGLAKKNPEGDTDCYFIPFCDPSDWFKSLSGLIRGYDLIDGLEDETALKKKINGSLSKLYSRHHKTIFEDFGLIFDRGKVGSYKDLRDVYAGVVFQTFKTIADSEDGAMDRTQQNMGHSNAEATKYYRKYDVKPLTAKKPIFESYIPFMKSVLEDKERKLQLH